jgi:hypothetical protein
MSNLKRKTTAFLAAMMTLTVAFSATAVSAATGDDYIAAPTLNSDGSLQLGYNVTISAKAYTDEAAPTSVILSASINPNDTVTIDGFTPEDPEIPITYIIIPETINDMPVVSIGLYDEPNFVALALPDSVTSIVIENCENFEGIVANEGTYAHQYALENLGEEGWYSPEDFNEQLDLITEYLPALNALNDRLNNMTEEETIAWLKAMVAGTAEEYEYLKELYTNLAGDNGEYFEEYMALLADALAYYVEVDEEESGTY